MDESELIRRFFSSLGARRSDVSLGIGDDAAVLAVSPGCELVMTTDALVEGVHFLPGAPPRSLGHRALAVNLSDIAAMGASPSWMLLSLILPQAQEAWLAEFCAGLAPLAERHAVALVGGNLSRGPLSITVELAGLVPAGRALRRQGARPGDALYVSGTPGDAAAGRLLVQYPTARSNTPATQRADRTALMARFEYPTARVALGEGLRSLASACIDVSDGLAVDARRMLAASGCAAQIDAALLPLSQSLQAFTDQAGWSVEQTLRLALCGGEDYELCFCAAPERESALHALAATLGERVTRIGAVTAGAGVSVTWSNSDAPQLLEQSMFDHFGR
ncbi:MAG TPA: thiamine-phosphate kinase [Steroidobacteraceae bacterium]|nr:thiamine-phosphate kinase [Steroidobacteraceae bacterium]